MFNGNDEKRIYVVTAGSYSDYHICGVFTKREYARDYASKFEGTSIEEWKLDPHVDELQYGDMVDRRPYFVRMQKDGTVVEVRIVTSDYGFRSNEADYSFDIEHNLYCHVFAMDSEHAIKITNEKRLHVLNDGDWPGWR